MGIVNIFFLFILTFNNLSVSEKHEKNIYNEYDVENDQILETTTSLKFEIDSPLPTPLPSSYDCEKEICITKCCPEGQLMKNLIQCENVSLHDTQEWKASSVENYITIIKSTFEVISSHKENFKCSIYKTNEFLLNDDGTIYHKNLQIYISHEAYCIDYMLENGLIEETAVLCYHEKLSQISQYVNVTNSLHTTAVALSAISLFTVVSVYMFTPHKLDLQKRCTLACCVNLLIGFSILLINRSNVTKLTDGNGCVILAILMQYFLLSFYFWLNINCYEIFRIIRGTFNLQSISRLSHSNRRFTIYFLYCHGCPFIICAVTIAMQLIPETSFPVSIKRYIIKPRINEGRCFLRDGSSQIAYYYVFEISLHVVNAFFMGYTSYLVYKDKLIAFFCRKRTSNVAIRTHATTNHFDVFKLQMRIYILYIFIWVMNTLTLIERRKRFWRIVDITVALQGVFVAVFILYTSRAALVAPLFEKISSSARELSSFIGEKKSFNSSATETSEISLNSLETRDESGNNNKV